MDDANQSPEKRTAVSCDAATGNKPENTRSEIQEKAKETCSEVKTEGNERPETDVKNDSNYHRKVEKETDTCMKEEEDSRPGSKSGVEVLGSEKEYLTGSDQSGFSASGNENVVSANMNSPVVSASAYTENQLLNTTEVEMESASEISQGDGEHEDDGSGHETDPVLSEGEPVQKSAKQPHVSTGDIGEFSSSESDENEWERPWMRDTSPREVCAKCVCPSI